MNDQTNAFHERLNECFHEPSNLDRQNLEDYTLHNSTDQRLIELGARQKLVLSDIMESFKKTFASMLSSRPEIDEAIITRGRKRDLVGFSVCEDLNDFAQSVWWFTPMNGTCEVKVYYTNSSWETFEIKNQVITEGLVESEIVSKHYSSVPFATSST